VYAKIKKANMLIREGRPVRVWWYRVLQGLVLNNQQSGFPGGQSSSLLKDIMSAVSLLNFRRRLKTHLYK